MLVLWDRAIGWPFFRCIGSNVDCPVNIIFQNPFKRFTHVLSKLNRRRNFGWKCWDNGSPCVLESKLYVDHQTYPWRCQHILLQRNSPLSDYFPLHLCFYFSLTMQIFIITNKIYHCTILRHSNKCWFSTPTLIVFVLWSYFLNITYIRLKEQLVSIVL